MEHGIRKLRLCIFKRANPPLELMYCILLYARINERQAQISSLFMCCWRSNSASRAPRCTPWNGLTAWILEVLSFRLTPPRLSQTLYRPVCMHLCASQDTIFSTLFDCQKVEFLLFSQRPPSFGSVFSFRLRIVNFCAIVTWSMAFESWGCAFSKGQIRL